MRDFPILLTGLQPTIISVSSLEIFSVVITQMSTSRHSPTFMFHAQLCLQPQLAPHAEHCLSQLRTLYSGYHPNVNISTFTCFHAPCSSVFSASASPSHRTLSQLRTLYSGYHSDVNISTFTNFNAPCSTVSSASASFSRRTLSQLRTLYSGYHLDVNISTFTNFHAPCSTVSSALASPSHRTQSVSITNTNKSRTLKYVPTFTYST
jgi:hypothetical protein